MRIGICIKHSFLNNDIDCLSNDCDETNRNNPNYDFVKKLYKRWLYTRWKDNKFVWFDVYSKNTNSW